MLINIKMPTIVGILTFISMINTTSESSEARIFLIFQHFSFYRELKFHVQLLSMKKVLLPQGQVLYMSLYQSFSNDSILLNKSARRATNSGE